MLGEKIEATITAKYYFGSPVTKAKVKYKIERTSYRASAGTRPCPGTGSTAPATGGSPATTPGIRAGGSGAAGGRCPSGGRGRSRRRNWSPTARCEIGPDGTVKVEIDTAVAKAIHARRGPQLHDHRRGGGRSRGGRSWAPAACWWPASRSRSMPGSIAAITASATRSTPVSPPGGWTASRSRARASSTLLRITYDKGKPVETPVQTWKLDTDEEGQAQQQLTASQAGQYRLSYKLTDAKNHTIEGGYVFTIIGEGFQSASSASTTWSWCPTRPTTPRASKVKLQINTDRAGGTVLLFAAADQRGLPEARGRCGWTGKSTVQEIEVVTARHAELLRRGGHRGRRPDLQRDPRDRRAAGEAGAERRGDRPRPPTYRPGQKAKVQSS